MSNTQLTPEQYELFKNAETYLKQKRLLYSHFFVFVLGCVFFFGANKILDYGVEYNWYLCLSYLAFFMVVARYECVCLQSFSRKKMARQATRTAYCCPTEETYKNGSSCRKRI